MKNSTEEVLLVGVISSLLFIFSQSGMSETTRNKEIEIYEKNGVLYYRFVYQERYNSQSTQAQSRPSTRQPVTVQERGTYMRGPSSGSRARAITQRGGEAATQVCGGPMEILNMSGKCNEKEYDKDFLRILQTEGLVCAREAAHKAFGFAPTSVKLHTGEGQVSASRTTASGKVSTHAVGRALDIFKVDLYNGVAFNTITMHKNHMSQHGHRTFYFAFGDCWRSVVERVRGIKAGSYGSGCLDFEYNHAHHNHMHMSLPPMDSDRRAYGISAT